ncbi:MAG: hypothetical protein Q9212_004641 [Teloschistes hypoglaucus]
MSRSPGPKGSTPSLPSLTGTGRSSPVRSTSTISRSARGSVKKANPNLKHPGVTPPVLENPQESDARAEQASIMDEYRDRASKAEAQSEDFQRQIQMIQSRLNESLAEHSKYEEQLHEREEKLVGLEDQVKQATRQRKELEHSIEAERNAMSKDQTEQKTREQELQAANQRLKDNLAERDSRIREMSDSEAATTDRSISQPTMQLSDSQESSKDEPPKDRVIEALRFELAESQIKMMELENVGSSRQQELEKTMLETRVTNARLMEENESFQLLLSEKTLNGDFSKTEVMQPSNSLASLEEELESAEGESDNYRRLEMEAKALKDQNKALTLYIENIIGRLLSHKEFENVLEKSPDLMSSIARPDTLNKEKELPPPPPPPPKDDEPAPSLLQRARSVVNGPRRPRPLSFMGAAASFAKTGQDSRESASVPMTPSSARLDSHRRSQSEMPLAAPAPIVNQMYRGPPSSGSGGPLSPGISPGTGVTRNPFLASSVGPGAISSNATSRAPSGSRFSQERPESSSNSTYSDKSGDLANKERNKSGGYTNYPGAVMTQSRLRPLRLVQENREMESQGHESGQADDMAARKKANRNSWMPGWFNQPKKEDVKGVGSENGDFF